MKCFIIRGELIGGEGADNPGRATVEVQVIVDGPGQWLGWRKVGGFERFSGGRTKETH